MKKNLIKIMSIVAAIVVMISVHAYANNVVKGDTNGDGKVTASDARSALRIAIKLDSADDEVYKRADFDGDGVVSVIDARNILRTAVRLPEETTTKTPAETTTKAPAETTTKNNGSSSWTPADFKDDGDEWNPNDDLKYSGNILMGDTKRIGMMYKLVKNGGYRIHSLDELEEGEGYIIYDEGGNYNIKMKPYSPGNEPTTEKDYTTGICPDCGKKNRWTTDNGPASANGGCTQFWKDKNCPECGVFVPKYTCHTCKR